MGLPPGKRLDGFELGQPETHLRIRHVSGIFKGVGQIKAGQVEKRWREDRAEDVQTGENCHVQGILMVSHDQQSPGPHTEVLTPQQDRKEEWKGRDTLREMVQGALQHSATGWM